MKRKKDEKEKKDIEKRIDEILKSPKFKAVKSKVDAFKSSVVSFEKLHQQMFLKKMNSLSCPEIVSLKKFIKIEDDFDDIDSKKWMETVNDDLQDQLIQAFRNNESSLELSVTAYCVDMGYINDKVSELYENNKIKYDWDAIHPYFYKTYESCVPKIQNKAKVETDILGWESLCDVITCTIAI